MFATKSVKDNNDAYLMTTVFVSKHSDSQRQFNGVVGDMYYFNHLVESGPGYSVPFQNTEFFDKFGVTIIEVYARLKTFTPMIKLELVNTTGRILPQDELDIIYRSDIPRLLNKLVYHSVAGYPHCLKLAHDNCLISDDYMERVSHLYGLHNEIGARAPLHERPRVKGDYVGGKQY